MTTAHTLVRSSIFRNAQFFVTVAVTFLMTPFLIHSLGARHYGLWILVATFIGYYGLLDLGLSTAVARYISRALGNKAFKTMSETASTSFGLFTVMSGVGLLVTALVVVATPVLLVADSREVDLFRQIFLLMGVTVAIGLPFKVFGGILTSFLRFDYIAIISIVRTIGANALVYVLLRSGHGILALVLITCLASCFEYVSLYFICHLKFPQVAIRVNYFDSSKIKELTMYSGKTLAIQVADLLRFRVDAFVIAMFLNVSLVTYYSVGSKLVDYFGSFIQSTTGIMTPLFSQYEGRGDLESLRTRFLAVTKLSTTLSVFIGLSIIFYGKLFIERWMGPGFESSYHVAVILCIPAIIALTQSPGLQLLYGLSKHHYYAVANCCEGLLNLLLSLVLVQHYGMYGVALGTALEMIFFKIIVQPLLICRAINIPLRAYLFDSIFLTGTKILLPLMIYFYFVSDYLKADYVNILFIGGLQAIIVIPIAYMFAVGDDVKQHIRSVLGIA